MTRLLLLFTLAVSFADRIESFAFSPGYQVLQKRSSVQSFELESRQSKRGCRDDDDSSSTLTDSDKEPPPPTPTFKDLEYFQNNIVSFLKNPDEQLKQLAGDLNHQVEYQTFAQGFNRRFKPRPYFIVYCTSAEEVKATFDVATKKFIPVRIRAGGHDHEGESSGDNLVVIDVSRMDYVTVCKKTGLASIGPGNKFEDLTTKLAKHEVMLPHGTCGTVAIAGFTMGGGWGPWTRKEGMCCEHLMGVTVILGNGEIIKVDAVDGKPVPELLWALRGGGGFSYGLVTEMRIQTFPLPKELIRFNITWNPYSDQLQKKPTVFPDHLAENIPTRDVIKMWESSILSSETPRLTGTNLQITGRPSGEDKVDYKRACNNCIMYGYWEGNEKSLREFVSKFFSKDLCKFILTVNPERGGTNHSDKGDYGKRLMSDWHRISTSDVLKATAMNNPRLQNALSEENQQLLKQDKPFPADEDTEAPHKITNRLVNRSGLKEEGYKAFIESLWSPLILSGNRQFGLNQYTTLGAIVGDYYKKNINGEGSAFPYNNKRYTIQYQTWWNADIADCVEPVYTRTNQALDWMEEVREYKIPNTSGSFISFKDSSIPTKTYFQQNYQRLIQAKKNYSRDPLNHFRSRKTII